MMSAHNLSPQELGELWLDEAERRARENDSGAAVPVSADEVANKARALVR
jgi:hypothetical protein